MARRFNGTSDFIVFTLPSVLQSLDAGPMTIALLASVTSTTDGAFLHTRTSGGTNSWWMECSAAQWNYGQGVAARDIGDLTTSEGWAVYAGHKGNGGAAAPVGRKIILGGATTTVTAPSALADGTAPGAGGILQVGKWGTAAEYLGADIACCAVWDYELSDAEIDALATSFGNWSTTVSAPKWLVKFTQASPTDAISDETGNGGGSSAITGTTIVSDPVGFFGGSPTNYTQSVSGGITPTSTLVRQTAKTVAGATTPAGALVRQAAKRPAGGITPAGSVTRRTAKSMAGAVTPVGALATLKATLRSFAGAITPTGTLTRQTNKVLAGAIAPAGSIRRATAKFFAGAITAAGTVAKQTAKRFFGAITPAGTVATSAGPVTPARDLQLTVGPPELAWTAGPPVTAWTVSAPELHWTAGPPEV